MYNMIRRRRNTYWDSTIEAQSYKEYFTSSQKDTEVYISLYKKKYSMPAL